MPPTGRPGRSSSTPRTRCSRTPAADRSAPVTASASSTGRSACCGAATETDPLSRIGHDAVAGLPLADQPRLRQTAAAILDEQRFSAREIADVLGHSRPSPTYVYMHRGAANPAAGAALNEALRPRTG